MPKELKSNIKIRFTLGSWYLATIVFVNAYIGLAITSLTKPFWFGSISSFSDLTDLHYSHEDIVRDYLWAKTVREYLTYDTVKHITETFECKYKQIQLPSLEKRRLDPDRDFYIFSPINVNNILYYSDSAIAYFRWMGFYDFFNLIMSVGNEYVEDNLYAIFTKQCPKLYKESPQNMKNNKNSHYFSPINTLIFNFFSPLHMYFPAEMEADLQRNL